jgi:hypothetical protein
VHAISKDALVPAPSASLQLQPAIVGRCQGGGEETSHPGAV